MLETKKNRYLPIAKTFFIIGLAALSVVLTVQLWLVNIPNRSFFPYMQARFTPTPPDGLSNLVHPFRIIYGVGDGYFNITYSNITGSPFWEYGEDAIAEILQNSSFTGQAQADTVDIENAPVIIFQYAFYMNPAIFAQAFGSRAGAALVEVGMQNFRTVVIYPPSPSDSNMLRVSFICDNYAWHFSHTPTGRQAHIPFRGIEVTPAYEQYRRFALSENAVFVQRFHENFTYHPIYPANPYVNPSGFLHQVFIGRQIEHFFDNPATINSEIPGGIYTFRNFNTVVRYLPGDVVEYTSFRTIGNAAHAGFVADFSAALAFVTRDPNVTNEIFLAGYEARNREHVFWFNYVVNNFPLVLTEYWYSSEDCNNPLLYPIEVVVDRGRVTRYRKIAYSFITDTDANVALDLSVGAEPLAFAIGSYINTEQHIMLQARRR